MMLVDAFSSSEALGMGSSVSSGTSAVRTAQFTLGPEVKVLDPDGNEVKPGSDQIGVLAIGGRNPLGYYKDEAKTAATFRTYDGVRYSIPGDYAEVGEDGKIQLLGRGSVVINTGGEKVYPEEVEEVVKTYPGVADAAVVGIPNERFGEEVVAAVELKSGVDKASVTGEQIQAYVSERLAAYKSPRRVRFVDSIGRTPAGKMDYGRHRDEAAAWAAVGA
jgi:fatty-acyl-CoA synthase